MFDALLARFPQALLRTNPAVRDALRECGPLIEAVLASVRVGDVSSTRAYEVLNTSLSRREGVDALEPREVRPARAALRWLAWDAAQQAKRVAIRKRVPPTSPVALAHQFVQTLAGSYATRGNELSPSAPRRLCYAASCLVPRDIRISLWDGVTPLYALLRQLPVRTVQDLDLLTGELERSAQLALSLPPPPATPRNPLLEGFHAKVTRVLSAWNSERMPPPEPGQISALVLEGWGLAREALSSEHVLTQLTEHELRCATNYARDDGYLQPGQLQEGLERIKTALDLVFPEQEPTLVR